MSTVHRLATSSSSTFLPGLFGLKKPSTRAVVVCGGLGVGAASAVTAVHFANQHADQNRHAMTARLDQGLTSQQAAFDQSVR